VLGRVDGAQDVLEVAGARAQDDAVRLHRVTLACQRHVSKVLVLPVNQSPPLSSVLRAVLRISGLVSTCSWLRIGSCPC
jgi:hypothetical protein